MITKRLEMIFQNAGGSRATIAVPEPDAALTAVQVQAAMNDIIAKNVFESNGGDLVAIAGARIVTRDVTELAVV